MQRIAPGVIAAALALAPGMALAADGLRMEDRSFLLSAMAVSAAQAQVGRLAAEKAQDDQVRRFAQAMVGYHQDAHARLSEAARRRGVEPLAEIDPPAALWLATLEALDGPRFDAAYLSGQEINLYTVDYIYQRESGFGADAELRQEAGRQAEDVDEHRRTARRLAADLASSTPMRVEDDTFLVFAMEVDRSQVRLGELAAEKAQDPRVREFARHMVDAHGPSFDQVAQAARADGVEPSGGISPVAQRMQGYLQGLSGPEFDREYMISQVVHHDHWFYRFEREAIHGLDGQVRDLAAKGVQLGKEHHDMARGIVDGLR